VLVCETDRLRLRWITVGDASFIMALVNDPDWLRFVGDRNIHNLDDARAYIDNRLRASYHKDGYGFFLVETVTGNLPVGISGFFRPEGLDAPDVGFGFLSEHRRLGYAFEATQACLKLAKDEFQIERILAITEADNVASIRLLEKLGLSFEKTITLDEETLQLYAATL